MQQRNYANGWYYCWSHAPDAKPVLRYIKDKQAYICNPVDVLTAGDDKHVWDYLICRGDLVQYRRIMALDEYTAPVFPSDKSSQEPIAREPLLLTRDEVQLLLDAFAVHATFHDSGLCRTLQQLTQAKLAAELCDENAAAAEPDATEPQLFGQAAMAVGRVHHAADTCFIGVPFCTDGFYHETIRAPVGNRRLMAIKVAKADVPWLIEALQKELQLFETQRT